MALDTHKQSPRRRIILGLMTFGPKPEFGARITQLDAFNEALDKLYKAGRFRRFGVSNFTAFELAEVVIMCKYNGWVRPTIYQGMYNTITRNIDTEVSADKHQTAWA